MAEAKIVLSADDRASRVIAGLRSSMGGLATEASTLARGFGLLGPAIIGGLSAGALTAFFKSAAQGIDALNDIKAATGASIENISALEDVAARTGISFDTVGSSLIKFNKALSDAKPDNDTSRVLQAIGLDAQKLKQIDPAEALRQTAVALSKFSDDGDKARATQILFGKSLREVAPLLKDLAEQGGLVATVTTKQAEEAKKFNDQLNGLTKNAQDTGRAIFSSLVPALNALFDEAKSAGGFGELIKKKFADGLAQIELQKTQDRIAGLKDEIGGLQKQIDAGAGSGNAFARLFGKSASEKIHELTTELLKLQEQEKKVSASRVLSLEEQRKLEDRGFTPKKAQLKVAEEQKPEVISAARTALAQYVDQQEKQLEALDHISERQQALNKLQELGTLGQIPQVRELVLALADKQQKLKDEAELLKELTAAEEALAAVSKKAANEEEQRMQQLLEFTGIAEDRRKQALTATLEKNAGFFTAEQLEKAAKGIAGIKDEATRADHSIEQLGAAFGNAFEDAIISGNSLSDVLKKLNEDILRILTRKLITEPITKQFTEWIGLLNLFGGSSADGRPAARGAVFDGGRANFANGGIVNRPTNFAFASGGSFHSGLMGEAGPEAILPLTRRGGKLGVAGGGHQVSVTQHISIGAGVSPSQLAQALAQAKEQVKGEVADQIHRGSRAFA